METQTTYGFPKANPAQALAAAEQLVRRHGGEAFRRVREDGSVEVATSKKAALDLYVVAPDGASTLVESLPPPPRYVYARIVMWLGIALFAATFAVAAIRFPNGTDDLPPEVGVALLAFIVIAVGGITTAKCDVPWLLRKRFGDDAGWRPMLPPSGWSPRSTAQLVAAEHLSDDGDGRAFVRERPDGTVEVATMRSWRLLVHLVDEDGAVLPLTTRGRSRGYLGGSGLILLGFAVVVAGGQLASSLGLPFWIPFLGFGVSAGGAVLASTGQLERRVRALEPAGGTWFELRTKVRDDGD